MDFYLLLRVVEAVCAIVNTYFSIKDHFSRENYQTEVNNYILRAFEDGGEAEIIQIIKTLVKLNYHSVAFVLEEFVKDKRLRNVILDTYYQNQHYVDVIIDKYYDRYEMK